MRVKTEDALAPAGSALVKAETPRRTRALEPPRRLPWGGREGGGSGLLRPRLPLIPRPLQRRAGAALRWELAYGEGGDVKEDVGESLE